MRLIKQNISRDGSGTVTLRPEDPEDMVPTSRPTSSSLLLSCPSWSSQLTPPSLSQWFAYNLIQPHDLLRASAIRRIVTTSATGSTSSTRIHTPLLLSVTDTHFDAQASSLHVSGRIAAETPHAKLGQYHTLDLEVQRDFSLEKGEGWDSVARELVREACDSRRGASAWAVVLGEGSAAVVVLTGERTVLRQRVDVGVPRKRGGGGAHDKVCLGLAN